MRRLLGDAERRRDLTPAAVRVDRSPDVNALDHVKIASQPRYRRSASSESLLATAVCIRPRKCTTGRAFADTAPIYPRGGNVTLR